MTHLQFLIRELDKAVLDKDIERMQHLAQLILKLTVRNPSPRRFEFNPDDTTQES